jgi:pyridoxine kinase
VLLVLLFAIARLLPHPTCSVLCPTCCACWLLGAVRGSETADVGNKAAVFPLQLLGFDVDSINSVHLSNHTGYNHVRGDVLKGDQLTALLDGLEKNGLLDETGHILTGYVGSESFLEALINVVTVVRSKNPSVRFVCDPVLGDRGRFYVPVEVYKQKVLPLADVITPNQFEAEKLTGVVVDSMDAAEKACRLLHDMGPPLVFITSYVVPNKSDTTMSIVASRRNAGTGQCDVWSIEFPRLAGDFTGTGDLCAALILAHSATSTSIPETLEHVINTMFAVLENTLLSSGESVKSRELKLIQSKAVIETPPKRFRAQQVR